MVNSCEDTAILNFNPPFQNTLASGKEKKIVPISISKNWSFPSESKNYTATSNEWYFYVTQYAKHVPHLHNEVFFKHTYKIPNVHNIQYQATHKFVNNYFSWQIKWKSTKW